MPKMTHRKTQVYTLKWNAWNAWNNGRAFNPICYIGQSYMLDCIQRFILFLRTWCSTALLRYNFENITLRRLCYLPSVPPHLRNFERPIILASGLCGGRSGVGLTELKLQFWYWYKTAQSAHPAQRHVTSKIQNFRFSGFLYTQNYWHSVVTSWN